MEKIDYSEGDVSHIITHFVGNKAKGQTLKISSGLTHVPVDQWETLLHYFISSFKLEEFFQFHHKESVEMNPVYTVIQNIFSDPSCFVSASGDLAQLLYEASVHPKVVDGELSICYFKNLIVNGQQMDAIGLFKSESMSTFIKYNHQESHYEVDVDFGYTLEKLDKGCLISNIYEEDGYEVLLVDQKSGGEEAHFWKDTFLGVKPIENNFYQTKVAMQMTKNFIESPVTEDMELSIADQIELLNKSSDFFKKNEQFDRGSFEEAVLSSDQLVKGFEAYEQTIAETQDLEFPTNFEISKPAVKKNSKIFKSILKLDKNFSIYIHGDRSRAERGTDEQGKYYKFYYDIEHYD